MEGRGTSRTHASSGSNLHERLYLVTDRVLEATEEFICFKVSLVGTEGQPQKLQAKRVLSGVNLVREVGLASRDSLGHQLVLGLQGGTDGTKICEEDSSQ
jgi:hypothetical protein